MSRTPKHQHVFLAQIVPNVVPQRVHPVEEIVFDGEDRERAKKQLVPDSGWIRLSPGDVCASQDEPAVQPSFAVTKDGKVIATLCTSGYDDKGVAVRVTGFLLQHRADITVGYGTTMMDKFQGATFVIAVDPSDFEQMEQELPELEDAMNRDYEANEHPQRAGPTRRYDVTIIVMKNQPGEFCKATGIVAKRNVNIRSMMGGPYTPKVNAGVEPPPSNYGAITLQIDVPVEGAEGIVAAIREEMEAQPGWFVSIREQGTGPRRASGGTRTDRRSPGKPAHNRTDDARGGAVTGQRADSHFVEAEHYGP